MSIRSTFFSPGGFTTQRLDLILQKRKDDVQEGDSGGDDGTTSPTTTSPTTTSTSPTTSLEENIRNKHAGALDRWRQKMAAKNSSSSASSSTSGVGSAIGDTGSSSHLNAGSRYRSSLDNDHDLPPYSSGIYRTNSFMEPRRRLDYGDLGDNKYSKYLDDNDSRKLDRHQSMVNLPRRRKENSRSSSGGSSNSHNGIGSRTGSSSRNDTSGTHGDRKGVLDNDSTTRGGKGSGSQSQGSGERPLISRRFQELFSSGNQDDEEEEEKGNESGENSPDSLEDNDSDSDGGGMEDVFKPFGAKNSASPLKRSLSSASTILRTGWSPSGRLIRDRYNISPSRDEIKSVKNIAKGTTSNWAAWKSGIGAIGSNSNSISPNFAQTSSGIHLDSSHDYLSSSSQRRKNRDENLKNRLTDSDSNHSGSSGSKWHERSMSPKGNKITSPTPESTSAKRGRDSDRDARHDVINKSPPVRSSPDSVSDTNAIKATNSNSTSAVFLPEVIPEDIDLPIAPTLPPVPTALHLKSFPGFVQSNNWSSPSPTPPSSTSNTNQETNSKSREGSSRRLGHWGGHIPTSTSTHKPPEWYLYRGSKPQELDQRSSTGQLHQQLNKLDHSSHGGTVPSSSSSNRPLDFLFHGDQNILDSEDSSSDSEDENEPVNNNDANNNDGNDSVGFKQKKMDENENIKKASETDKSPINTTTTSHRGSGLKESQISAGNNSSSSSAHSNKSPGLKGPHLDGGTRQEVRGTEHGANLGAPIEQGDYGPIHKAKSPLERVDTKGQGSVNTQDSRSQVGLIDSEINRDKATTGLKPPPPSTSPPPPSTSSKSSTSTKVHQEKAENKTGVLDVGGVGGGEGGEVKEQSTTPPVHTSPSSHSTSHSTSPIHSPSSGPTTQVLQHKESYEHDLRSQSGVVDKSKTLGFTDISSASSSQKDKEVAEKTDKLEIAAIGADKVEGKALVGRVEGEGGRGEISVGISDPGEATKSPRVSFSDDLKVVPPSPSAKRKQWSTVANTNTNNQPQTTTFPPISTTTPSTPTPSSTTPTSATAPTGQRPWEKPQGKTPVKGILQNGRREGEIQLRPEPDNSEMRQPDTEDEEEGDSKNQVSGYSQKRHSFSTSDNTHYNNMSTRQRYATFMNEARRSYSKRSSSSSSSTQSKISTPSMDRMLGRSTDKTGSNTSLNSTRSDYLPATSRGVQMRAKNRNTGSNPTAERSRRLSWREDDYYNKGGAAPRERTGSTTSLLETQRDRARAAAKHRGGSGFYDSADKHETKVHGGGGEVDDTRIKNRDNPPVDPAGLSFKDTMEQRKKQGRMVLPKTQDRTPEKDYSGVRSSKRGPEMSQRMDAHSSSAVTLSTLKQRRQKDSTEQGKDEGVVKTEVALEGDAAWERAGDAGLRSKNESSTSSSANRWSFRSKSKKKDLEGGSSGNNSPSTKKKESSGGDRGSTAVQSISNFFKRSKKGKKDNKESSSSKDTSGQRSVLYGEGDTNGADVTEPTPSNVGAMQVMGTSGNTGEELIDEGFGASPPIDQGGTGSNPSFSLGPHGHPDSNTNNADPLSHLFRHSQNDDQTNSRSSSVSSPARTSGTSNNDESDAGSTIIDKSLSVASDDLLSRSDSPALSAISSTDGTGSNRNKHYQKPDYKHFLDMDSLVASITTNNEAESSSGVSGTGSDAGSVSGIGSLEDLAMALLEQELREEGLLEGEPGKGDPSQNYQDRILSIKSDLQKFSAHLGRALKKHKHSDSERAPSISEVSLASTRSSRYGMRDPTAEAKPVTDPLLRSKLKSARSPGAKVTSRDQKILELMLQKRESERSAEAKREAVRRAWETEKEHENAVKTTAEVRRRESLAKIRNQDRELRRRDSDIDRRDIEDALKYKENKWSSQSQRIMELRPIQTRRFESRILKYQSMDDMRNKCERPWVAKETNGYLAVKEKKMAERRLQNMQRKKSAEDRIANQKREQEEMARLVLERQERELKRANSMKETREQEAIMQRKLKNYYQKKRVDTKLGDIKRKSREDVNSLQAAIEMKQATAQSHVNDITTRRNSSLRRSTTDLDTRISRSRENQQKLQEEISAWHTDLLSYRKSMALKAEEQAKQLVKDKAKRAGVERKQKEKLQRDNLKKLLDQEEEWKADVEATIAMKDARTRMIQMEREETVQESRAMAAVSQRMREELRSAYSSDNIDQLSRRAEIEAKIGLNTTANHSPGISSTTKNMSTLTLG